jgi:gamma-glutamylcyclotransferase (GGCT)/AIG2-like uncharacterized protein YtfP
VSAVRTAAPWTMPAHARRWHAALASIGVRDASALHALLADASVDVPALLAAAGVEPDVIDADALVDLRTLFGLHRMFVYGTLRDGLPNAHLLAGVPAASRGGAVTSVGTDFAMVASDNTDNTPSSAHHVNEVSARPSGDDVSGEKKATYRWPFCANATDVGFEGAPLVGELLCVDDATLAKLDKLEEHPNWYRRRLVAVAGHGEPAWVYLAYDPEVVAAIKAGQYDRVPSNDWRVFLKEVDG